MTVTLTPEQMRWLEEAVAQGRFPSVEDAVRAAVDGFIVDHKYGDLSWARPYIAEARAQVARGEVTELDEFLARLDQGSGALRRR
jgi:Arc/MetJ-type ribon-helix-helix transcriptional regulator